MDVGVVHRLETIHVQYEHGNRRRGFASATHDRAEVPLERAQVVQSGQIVGHVECVQPARVVSELRRDAADRQEQQP